MIDRADEGAGVSGTPILVWKDAGHDQRQSAFVPHGMAEETFHATAAKPRLVGLLEVQGIEHHSVARFERQELVHITAGNGADRHFVVEVQRARVLRVDDGLLETGFGEDQRLRIDVDAQMFEEAGQIPDAVAILESRLAALELLSEACQRVARCNIVRPLREHRGAKRDETDGDEAASDDHLGTATPDICQTLARAYRWRFMEQSAGTYQERPLLWGFSRSRGE